MSFPNVFAYCVGLSTTLPSSSAFTNPSYISSIIVHKSCMNGTISMLWLTSYSFVLCKAAKEWANEVATRISTTPSINWLANCSSNGLNCVTNNFLSVSMLIQKYGVIAVVLLACGELDRTVWYICNASNSHCVRPIGQGLSGPKIRVYVNDSLANRGEVFNRSVHVTL